MFRIGFGNDTHRLTADKPLIIGGLTVESDLGADGHSDADALLHAVTDAILGALALGDIGALFPDTSADWKNADSRIFVREAVRLMKIKGYQINNLDAVVNLERPKLRPHIGAICRNLAELLETDLENISVKAKTGEKVDAVGERRAIKTEAIVLLQKINQ